MTDGYTPQDTMTLWWLGSGLASPTKIGQLMLAEGNRKVGLVYGAEWIRQGFALSEDLPLGTCSARSLLFSPTIGSMSR